MTNRSDEPLEYASPPCYAHEINPEYNGMTNQQHIIAALQELLEGERAGARIARETLEVISGSEPPDDFTKLVSLIGNDEIRYCSMLIGQIERLGGSPSQNTGEFYQKCIAIEDLSDRLVYLNRGQDWVVRRIDELLPGIVDQVLKDYLIEMRDTHQSNISLTNQSLQR